ncbi:telomere resolvase [Leptolyngbya sp. GB1-A1]|uniref:protelomerase family protein n=1 Tax=Leptolyngbya sp. GB1-A1 TaxID=2933908 RepID=UPI0032993E5A
MTRDQIISRYRQRINENKLTKLSAEEQAILIREFISSLLSLTCQEDIQARCQEEIALLEEGYGKETVAKTRLNQYRAAIAKAVAEKRIRLTESNSKKYTYEKKKGAEKTGEIGQAHHHYAWFYMRYDNETYLSFNQ